MGLVALTVLDSWARRQHRLCVRDPEQLSPAARLLLDTLLQGAGEEALAVSVGDAILSKR
jgi:hypothetical protein